MFDPGQFHDPEFRTLVLAARAVIAERVHRGGATPPGRRHATGAAPRHRGGATPPGRRHATGAAPRHRGGATPPGRRHATGTAGGRGARRDTGRRRPRRGAGVGVGGRVPGCGSLSGARDAGVLRRHRQGAGRRSQPRGRRRLRDDALTRVSARAPGRGRRVPSTLGLVRFDRLGTAAGLPSAPTPPSPTRHSRANPYTNNPH